MALLQQVRMPQKRVTLQKGIVHSAGIAVAGLIAGAVSKLLDLYTTNLGNIFSQLSIWILICSAIAVYSSNSK